MLCLALGVSSEVLGGGACASRAGRRGRRGQEPGRFAEARDVRVCSLALLCARRPGEDPHALRPQGWGRGLGTRASTVPPQEGSSLLPRFALPGNRATSYAEIRRGAGVQAQQPLMPASVPGPGGGCPRSLGLPGRPWHEAAAPTTGSWTRDCRVRYHPPGLPCCSAVMAPSSILCHSHTVILVAFQEKIHVHLSGLIRCYLVKFIQTKY